MAVSPPSQRISLPVALSFASTALPIAAIGLVMAVYLPRFFAGHLGLSMVAVGAAITIVRLIDLAVQDSAKVRRFITKYQDRILFGTDVVMRTPPSSLALTERAQVIDALRTVYTTHFAYFESKGNVTVRERTTEGLGLPQRVLDNTAVNALNAKATNDGLALENALPGVPLELNAGANSTVSASIFASPSVTIISAKALPSLTR